MVENKGKWVFELLLEEWNRKIRILALEFELQMERSNTQRLCKLEETVIGLRVQTPIMELEL